MQQNAVARVQRYTTAVLCRRLPEATAVLSTNTRAAKRLMVSTQTLHQVAQQTIRFRHELAELALLSNRPTLQNSDVVSLHLE